MRTTEIPSSHTDAIVCCVAHRNGHVVLSGGEDAKFCLTDVRTSNPLGALHLLHGDVVGSVCCSPINEHAVYAANGRHVVHIDIRKDLGLEAIVDSYRINTDEINSLDIDSSGSWIAASDDSGEVQVISLSSAGEKPTYRTLRNAHSNICCAASFRHGDKLEIISGGLDCRLVHWDVSRLRVVSSFDVGGQQTSGTNLDLY